MDELIEGGARPSRVRLPELRTGQSEHEIGIVLVQAAQGLPIDLDRFGVAAAPHQLFRVTLAARDVAGEACLPFQATQVRIRIERFLEAARGALCGPAAQQLRDHLDREVSEDTRIGQEHDDPDPDGVAPGLDHMDDQERLDQDRYQGDDETQRHAYLVDESGTA